MTNALYISKGKNREERCARAAQVHRTLMEIPDDSPLRADGETPEHIEHKFVAIWLQFVAARHKELLPCGVGFTMLHQEIMSQNDLPHRHALSVEDFDLKAGLVLANEFAQWQVAAE